MARQRNKEDGEKREREKERINPSRDNSTLESTRDLFVPSLSVYQELPKNGKEMEYRRPGGHDRWRKKKEEEKKRRREDVKGNRAEANGIGQISRSVTVFPGHISRARSNEKF